MIQVSLLKSSFRYPFHLEATNKITNYLECNKGKPYNITMKLSGCAENEFTCNDGQCIDVINRCDQIIDCRDESDEQECTLLRLKSGYNKMIPPFITVIC